MSEFPPLRWRWPKSFFPGPTTGRQALLFLPPASIHYDEGMSDSATAADAAAVDLARLQHELLRTRIDRARRMTEEQRLAEAFALTDGIFLRMHEGAMAEMAATDPALGWQQVRRRLERLRRARGVIPPANVPSAAR